MSLIFYIQNLKGSDWDITIGNVQNRIGWREIRFYGQEWACAPRRFSSCQKKTVTSHKSQTCHKLSGNEQKPSHHIYARMDEARLRGNRQRGLWLIQLRMKLLFEQLSL